MKPLVGWGLGGATFTARDLDSRVRVGEPVWSPSALLRDLELRLGIPHAVDEARVPRWAARIQKINDPSAFYAKSFSVDPLGTAKTILQWRDSLLDAGWDGLPISDCGDRLDAIARIEDCTSIPLPFGSADRALNVERELKATKHRIYDELELIERRQLWSMRWQRIFTLLEQRGTKITQTKIDLSGAPADTDLGLLQRLIRGDLDSRKLDLPNAIRGDGSLTLLRGDTPTELASLTASMLAKRAGPLVIRALDNAPLEAALLRHGLAGQGLAGLSTWRPAMQILPLALELAYEPRDPYRVLELLTLPVGPFRGVIGSQLARAVASQPGIGGREWIRSKERSLSILREAIIRNERDADKSVVEATASADAFIAAANQQITEWFETRGVDETATRAQLIAIVTRVRDWIQDQLASETTRSAFAPAYTQTAALIEALTQDHRGELTREDARHMLDTVVRAYQRHVLSSEQVGRIAHVEHPSAIVAPAKTIVFWGFVSGTERQPVIPPWNRAEKHALQKAGIVLPDLTRLLSVETNAWRRGVLAAQKEVIFVVPNAVRGEASSPHSLWDEIAARLRLDNAAESRLSHHAQNLLRVNDEKLAAIEALAPLELPSARPTWNVPLDVFSDVESDKKTSATALELLASCPFSWVLARRAKIRPGSIGKVASGALLNGSLSHRLVEDLYLEHAFDIVDEDAFRARASAVFDHLIETEGATLRLFGSSFERGQLKKQVLRAMRALRRYLAESGFHIAGVEEDVSAESRFGLLIGRLDVRLEDANGNVAVLDLKWGSSSYEDRIVNGRAIQLAAYSQALRTSAQAPMPPVGYFSLSAARLITADARMHASRTIKGATMEDTWDRVERTSTDVVTALGRGEIHVAARKALPLVDRLGVTAADRGRHFISEPDEPCTYCPYPALCGRQWEELE